MMATILALTTCVRVGEGTVAPLHEQKLKSHDVQTIGIIDTDEKKKSSPFKWFESYEAAAAANPTFWDVCTPPDQHLSVIKKIIAVDPKARMIVEKPICMSHEIEELNEVLKTFQGKLVVNENYLSSDITEKVRAIAFDELKLQPTRIVIEMDKNRMADFKKGRYVDPEGAFKYEGTHIITILDSLGIPLPSKPTSVVYEDLSPAFPQQGSADILFESGSLQVKLYSSMKGTLKNHYAPYARAPIEEHETAPRYRVVAIEGGATTIVGFYEPLPNHPRSIGEVVVLVDGKVIKTYPSIPDDTMGKHLGKAVDYLTGKTEVNPCPPETAIRIVERLDSVLPKAN